MKDETLKITATVGICTRQQEGVTEQYWFLLGEGYSPKDKAQTNLL